MSGTEPSPNGTPPSKRLQDGGTVEPVREILWGSSAGVRKYETAEEVPPDMRKLVVKLLVVQADTEFASIQQHRPWLDRAPTSKTLKDGGTVEPVREILWGSSAGVRKYETADEVPPDMQKLVIKLLVVQADTEFASIQQHRPWLDRAPTLEDRWIEARIVADEARHGLQACRILRDFGEEGQRFIDELLAKKEGEHKLDAFNMKFDAWSDVGAFTCFVDRVGVYQLRAFQECSYGRLARAMPLPPAPAPAPRA